jgi:glycosyltransferase involved in cell wall biosynthesis
MIQAVGVVIPAHNEEDLLPSCLAAVREATRRLHRTAVHIVVVADACTDRTAEQARRGGAVVREIQARCVGSARRTGMREVLRRTRHLDRGRVWLATTDADTLVPPEWLGQQLHYANDGWDAVVGTVTVTDWSEHPPGVPSRFHQRYRSGGPGTHPHVHGANLGFTASAYLVAGGFRPRRTAEDHALVASLTAAERRILRTTEINVLTSARRHARAPRGFSQLLSSLAGPAQPGAAELAGAEAQASPARAAEARAG